MNLHAPFSLLALCLALPAGVALGTAYFRCLAWSTRLFAEAGNAWAAIALTLGRFAILGASLYIASRHGAWPLLAMAGGILIARHMVMRGARAALA